MQEICRTQINRDGTIYVWNSENTNGEMKSHIIPRPNGVSAEKLAWLNSLRDFNRLSEMDKYYLKFPEAKEHVPGQKGNCLSQAR